MMSTKSIVYAGVLVIALVLLPVAFNINHEDNKK